MNDELLLKAYVVFAIVLVLLGAFWGWLLWIVSAVSLLLIVHWVVQLLKDEYERAKAEAIAQLESESEEAEKDA